MGRKTHIQKIKELEKELANLKKAILKPKKYKPVVCNGLMWSKIAPKEMNWNEAMDYAKDLREGGYKDWRLPTVRELQDVFDYEKGEPKINFEVASVFWSSTEVSHNPAYAWYVRLDYGYTYNKTKFTDTPYVRCVRRTNFSRANL